MQQARYGSHHVRPSTEAVQPDFITRAEAATLSVNFPDLLQGRTAKSGFTEALRYAQAIIGGDAGEILLFL